MFESWQAFKTSLIAFQQPLNSTHGLYLNGRNHCYVIRNVCLSRRRKADLESSQICLQTLVSLTHLRPLTLRIPFLHQSVKNQFSTVT
jgi:hypothetical protein